MTADRKVNMCTVSVHISPEVRGNDGLELSYACVNRQMSVRACRFYKPFVSPVGKVTCPEECLFFEDGCRCAAARKAAEARARSVIAGNL